MLAPPTLEQLALLSMLIGDTDAEVARAVETTLAAIPEQLLASFLARADVPAEMRTVLFTRSVEPRGPATKTGDHPFGLPPSGPETDARLPALQRIAGLTVPQRVALATKGTREERAILVRDPNKLVADSTARA